MVGQREISAFRFAPPESLFLTLIIKVSQVVGFKELRDCLLVTTYNHSVLIVDCFMDTSQKYGRVVGH